MRIKTETQSPDDAGVLEQPKTATSKQEVKVKIEPPDEEVSSANEIQTSQDEDEWY